MRRNTQIDDIKRKLKCQYVLVSEPFFLWWFLSYVGKDRKKGGMIE